MGEVEASADLHANTMAKAKWSDTKIIYAEISRILVNMERYVEDVSKKMTEVVQCIIYTQAR
ncbi:hypothetical protein [Sulfitobacter sp. SK012]|uniref:hypothetical protein n=1 Tax=Sulfitobacter sp. SK012 TaxID=1389005 RepID=UPI0013B37BA3|nr:hypothetical protein [Sulfitobacter sp. SK012]